MEGIQVVTQDFVNVHITKSDSDGAAPVERRFKKEITVLEFKVTMIHRLFISYDFIYSLLPQTMNKIYCSTP